MSTLSSSRIHDVIDPDRKSSTLFNIADTMNYVSYRSDVTGNEKNIPNIFGTPEFNQSDGVFYPLSLLEKEKDIPNVFNCNGFQKEDSTSICNNADKFVEYPDFFTLHEKNVQTTSLNNYLWEKNNNYTSLFSLSDILHIDCAQNLEIINGDNGKQEKKNVISDDKLLCESSKKEVSTGIDNPDVNKLNKIEKSSSLEENSEENKSSALCFWCVVTGANVRDNNLKTYFPQKEISSICIMKDIKHMLINMGTIYFSVDEETLMYKHNGNISVTGLTPEMFESASKSILECSNLYKMLCSTMTKWKEIHDNSVAKALIFAVSNILNDYERTIFAVPNESLLSLVNRLFHITPRLQLLADICGLKIQHGFVIPDCIPCGVHLINKVHSYLFEYRFPSNLFLKMLLYIFQACCLAYFRILSNWTLTGVLNNKENDVFIKLKPDIEDEDNICRKNWDSFIIDESIEVPMFLDKYKNNILHCGKTINFFNKFNDLNVFLPDLTCCFDSIDTQKVYEQFSIYFKYDSSIRTANCVKRMSNCYLFESVVGPEHPEEYSGNNDIQNGSVGEAIKMYSDDENYELFQIPNWTSVNNSYDFNKPYGFFINYDDSLTYNDKPFDVVNMIDYMPHSILIPARIQKSVCDKQILDMYFVQENLMGHLYYLSQCFFLMNWQFSSKLCETLFNGIATNRKNPANIFNTVKLKSIVDEAIQDNFPENKQHNLTLKMSYIPHLNGVINISDVECLELLYYPEWPMNMILSNKILLKYKRIFLFANKLEYVSWSLLKAREFLNVYKNDTGLQFRKINLFKHWMYQFVSSIQQYYKQVVVGTCWSELNEHFENVENYDDLYLIHKQYMHSMLRRCFMVVGFKDKLILLNKIYCEILTYYQALASGQFYMKDSERLHSEFFSMEQSFSRFLKLREMFYNNILKTVQTREKHFVQLESLITILGPLNSIT